MDSLQTVVVDWASPPLRTVSTAATVEVDVMPFLGRTPKGGPFESYFTALSNLGATHVRFSPWYGYPRVTVAELYPPDCTSKGTSWNSTLLDQILADFMAAVCGSDAAMGKCKENFSTVPQLSTIPDWMFEPDGINRTALMPIDPWQFPSG